MCTKTTFGTQKWWPLLTGGLCSEVIYVNKIQNGTSNWWSLKAGGRYSEVVVNSGLTAFRSSFANKVYHLCLVILSK